MPEATPAKILHGWKAPDTLWLYEIHDEEIIVHHWNGTAEHRIKTDATAQDAVIEELLRLKDRLHELCEAATEFREDVNMRGHALADIEKRLLKAISNAEGAA